MGKKRVVMAIVMSVAAGTACRAQAASVKAAPESRAPLMSTARQAEVCEVAVDYVGRWHIVVPQGCDGGSLRDRIWFWASEYHLTHGEAGETIENCRQVLAESKGDDKGFESDCQTIMTMAHCMRREWVKADSVALATIALAEAMRDSDLMCLAHSARAYIGMSSGDIEKAEAEVVRALDFEKCIRDSSQMCRLMCLASGVYCAAGQYAVSLGFANDGLRMAEGSDCRCLKAQSLMRKGEVLLRMGQLGQARECMIDAIRIFRDDGNSYRLASCYLVLGRINLVRDQKRFAADCFSESADLFNRHDDMPRYCEALAGLYMATDEEEKTKRESIEAAHDEAARRYNGNEAERGDIVLPTMSERLGDIEVDKMVRYALIGAGILALALAGVVTVSRWRRRHRKAGVRHTMRRMALLLMRRIPFVGARNEALTESDQMFLARFAREVRKDMKSGKVDLRSVAQGMRLNEWRLQQRVLDVTGKTAERYIKSIRVGRARQLFDDMQASTAEASRECGYASVDDFAYDFAEIMGMTPQDYRSLRGLQ